MLEEIEKKQVWQSAAHVRSTRGAVGAGPGRSRPRPGRGGSKRRTGSGSSGAMVRGGQPVRAEQQPKQRNLRIRTSEGDVSSPQRSLQSRHGPISHPGGRTTARRSHGTSAGSATRLWGAACRPAASSRASPGTGARRRGANAQAGARTARRTSGRSGPDSPGRGGARGATPRRRKNIND